MLSNGYFTTLNKFPPEKDDISYALIPSAPIWSADSRRLAYFNRRIFVIDTNGIDQGQFEYPAGSIRSWNWLSDSQHIGFIHTDAQGVNKLMILDLATQSITTLSMSVDGIAQLAWSPDGKYLVYRKADQIYFSNADGTNAKILAIGSNPVWSPDSQHLAFLMDDGKHTDYKGAYTELYVIGLDGSPAVRLIGGRISSPSWGS